MLPLSRLGARHDEIVDVVMLGLRLAVDPRS